MLARFHVVANDDKWALLDALPDGLDESQAVVYRELETAPEPRLGGRWLVFEDQVWWGRPVAAVKEPEEATAEQAEPAEPTETEEATRWQRAIVTAADLEGTPTRWERVTA